jgi:hypothetical protein
MKNSTILNRGLKVVALAVALLSIQGSANAQIDIGTLMKAGAADGSKLVGAFISPTLKGFGAGMNAGWYNTAKTHGLGRFDVTINFNAVMIPTEDELFNASSLGFQNLQIKTGTGPNGATLAGSDDLANNAIYQLLLDDPTNPGSKRVVTEFASPKGLGIPYSGAPTAQLSVGLFKNTEVMFRYIPTISLGDYGDVGLMGFGLKHDIKQWIPGIKLLPFDMAAFFGYTNFNVDGSLDLKAEALPAYSGNTNTNYTDQSYSFNTKASTFGLIVSKKIALITAYGAVNYQTSKSEVALNGNFPLTVIEDQIGNPNFGNNAITNIKDPVNITVNGANGMTGTLGLRLKLLIVTFQGAYTFGKYPMATAGIGINLDWK